jgi:ribosomal protein S18 acetylase RimI-like enzyme
MQVIGLRQPDRIRSFLLTDRFFADYALGDLDPAHFQFTEWFGAEEDGELRALVMVYHDLKLPLVFALGAGRGLEPILDQVVRFPQIEMSVREEHLPIVEKFYRMEPVPMLKMALEGQPSLRAQSATHAPHQTACGCSAGEQSVTVKDEIASASFGPLVLTRLDVSHMPLLEELYSFGGGDAFRQRSLELGVFYGVLEGEQLVSVAGTHIVSDNERIAALGNVMTHPDYRGQGLATIATSAVCEELLSRGIEMIGLSVSRSNEAAQQVYEKIGFKRHVPFYEGAAIRIEIKDPRSDIEDQAQESR